MSRSAFNKLQLLPGYCIRQAGYADKTTVLNGQPSRRVSEVAHELGLNHDRILPHGHYIAKIPIASWRSDRNNPTAI